MKTPRTTHAITLNMTESVHTSLEEMADELQATRAETIRKALALYRVALDGRKDGLELALAAPMKGGELVVKKQVADW